MENQRSFVNTPQKPFCLSIVNRLLAPVQKAFTYCKLYNTQNLL
ncbi:hypothetical protein ANACOL_01028 [Anaerotruncus colihominis DSM 17241]|uniref:Uncharacterized protein n=1 Tax=Anaerotruncus colihominis DSM 17241 TaxID=445972 RepID=B0P8D8_9FIRM|nr:hypothetical protein ANACOL_01028 [Anaerotruncus colihominis DSM 17241]